MWDDGNDDTIFVFQKKIRQQQSKKHRIETFEKHIKHDRNKRLI